MSMPQDSIQIIMEALREMREQQRHDTERLHDKLDAMMQCGSTVARTNAKKLDDACSLVEKHEAYINRQAGTVATIGVSASVLTMILIKIGAFLLQKVDG